MRSLFTGNDGQQSRFKWDIVVLVIVDVILWFCIENYNILSAPKHPFVAHLPPKLVHILALLAIIAFQWLLFKVAHFWMTRYGLHTHRFFAGLLMITTFGLLVYLELCTFAIAYTYLGVMDTGTRTIVYDFNSALYFSAITFTTIGYGDYVPSVHARPLACVEGFTGYIALAIIVAAIGSRLVSHTPAGVSQPPDSAPSKPRG